MNRDTEQRKESVQVALLSKIHSMIPYADDADDAKRIRDLAIAFAALEGNVTEVVGCK